MILNPEIEPKPGYDRKRLECMAFMLAFGLRIGEVLALPDNALEDMGPAGWRIRVLTEKGGAIFARPVPALWLKAVLEAQNYLLSVSVEARTRARQIETSGFSFVNSLISDFRNQNPISSSRSLQMFISSLPNENFAFVDEIARCFDVSPRSFSSSDGEYKEALVPLVGEVEAKLVDYLSSAISRISTTEKLPASKRNAQSPQAFTLEGVARAAKISPSSISRNPEFCRALRRIVECYNRIWESGSFDRAIYDELGRIWFGDEEPALKRATDKRGTSWIVSLDILKKLLSEKYAAFLERHCQETITPEEDSYEGAAFATIVNNRHIPPLSNHMIVLWENDFNARQKGRGFLPRPMFRYDIYSYLNLKSQKATIFERLKITGSDGKIFSMSPHMTRHWLTDAMLRSGPSELVVDLWMGRKPGQARHYDHRTAKERAEDARSRYTALTPPDDYLGRRVIKWREDGLDELALGRLVTSRLAVLHFTPWGGCSRDLVTSPCDRGMMCMRWYGTEKGCKSFHIDPHDLNAREAIIKMKNQYMALLRIIEPEEKALRELLNSEINSTETLDQHISFAVSLVNGCVAALAQYSSQNPTVCIPGENA